MCTLAKAVYKNKSHSRTLTKKETMADTPYYSMRTPKRGLKTVDARDIDPHQPALFDYRLMTGRESVPGGAIRAFLFAPFHLEETDPGWLNALVVGILVFLGCLVNGWVLMAAVSHAITVAGDEFIRGILIALVSASLFYVTQLWTYDASLQTYVYPEISFAMIPTFKVGLLTAIGYGIFQFGGYAAAGGIQRAIKGVAVATAVNDVSTLNASVLYWFGATVIVFNYIYNIAFRQGKMEGPARQHRRATAATALAIFAITVAFYSLKIFTYSSGLYLTTFLVSGVNANAAFLVCIALLAVPATVSVLYLVIYYLTAVWKSPEAMTLYEKKNDGGAEPAGMNARLSENLSKRVASKIQVEY